MKIIIRIEKCEEWEGWEITAQTEGFPKTTAFLEGLGDTTGLLKGEAEAFVEDVIKDTKEANPTAQIVLEREGCFPKNY